MILLDTHVLVWSVIEPEQLSRAAAHAIRSARREGGLAISAITLYEVARLLARSRISGYGTVETSVIRLV
ncbi:MAG: PIN domain-containing protein, partial [Acidobacteriales bacterium]|nr:PIN domain-containing protein [Terriglobales bacterium]